MNRKLKQDCILYALPVVLLCLVIAWALAGTNISILNPQEIIALTQVQRMRERIMDANR